MNKCANCDYDELVGAIYCSNCGAFLLEADEAPDGTLHPFTNISIPSSKPLLVGQDVEQGPEANQVSLVIPSSGRRMELELDGDIRVGRIDPNKDNYPEVDLTGDGGAERGISRLHAVIRPSDEGVVIIDMNSTNGTTLNGYRLPPELPYPLNSGDEVRFAELLVHVFLE